MDEAHDLLRLGAVAFAVAQEDVRVERGAHAGGEVVVDEHRPEEAREPLAVGERRGVVLLSVAVEALQVAAEAIELGRQRDVVEDGQHRDMLLYRAWELLEARGAVLVQEPLRHGHHDKLHLRELVGREGGVRPICGVAVPDRSVGL